MIHIQRNTRLRTRRGTPIIPRCAALVLPHGANPVIVIGCSPVRGTDIEHICSKPLQFGAYGISGVPYLAVQVGSARMYSAPINTYLLKRDWRPFLHPDDENRPTQVSIALAEGVSRSTRRDGGTGRAPTLTLPAASVAGLGQREHPPGTVRAIRPAFLPNTVARSLRVLARNERRAFGCINQVNHSIHQAVKSGFQQRMALATTLHRPCSQPCDS